MCGPATRPDQLRAVKHLSALLDRLTDLLSEIAETGEPEPPEVFAPTLLRLRLLIQA